MIYVPLLMIGVKLPRGFLLEVGVAIGDLEADSAIGSGGKMGVRAKCTTYGRGTSFCGFLAPTNGCLTSLPPDTRADPC